MAQPLLTRVASGDRDAVRQCLSRYGGFVWSLARRWCPGHAEAEDAVQDIFIELWRSASRFDPAVASEQTFVAVIARRRLIDRARAASRRPIAVELDADASTGDEHRVIERQAEAGIAARAIEQLAPEQQRALVLATRDGLTHTEIAAVMGIPLGTAKSHVRNALVRIRERLNPAGTAAGKRVA